MSDNDIRCPRDGTVLAAVAETEHWACPRCRGVWGTRSALEALIGSVSARPGKPFALAAERRFAPGLPRASTPAIGRPLATRARALSLEGDAAERCPSCSGPLDTEEPRDAVGYEVLVCRACARVWMDEATASHLSRKARSVAPPAEAAPSKSERPERVEPPSDDGRFFEPGPLRALAILAGLFVVSWAIVTTNFGETLSYLPRIQFHELGHAIVAWSTGRRAIPLPFGWTSWSLERSTLLALIEVLFGCLLALHGVRERDVRFLIAAGIWAVVFGVGLSTSLDASEPWLVAGGVIGEALLPAVALAAFHLRLPARVRWDFWRWILALFAIVALTSVARHFLDIEGGARPLPMGSFLGRGDGDLDRLVRDYGWTEDGLRALFGTLARLSLVLGVAVHPLVLGVRWFRERASHP